MQENGWEGDEVFTVLPACWGGGVAGCRRTTSAPPLELGSASQTASPAPAPRPAGRPYSHTAPFTHWEQSTGQDRTRSNTREQEGINQHQDFNKEPTRNRKDVQIEKQVGPETCTPGIASKRSSCANEVVLKRWKVKTADAGRRSREDNCKLN